jgi:hypothetical protein
MSMFPMFERADALRPSPKATCAAGNHRAAGALNAACRGQARLAERAPARTRWTCFSACFVQQGPRRARDVALAYFEALGDPDNVDALG